MSDEATKPKCPMNTKDCEVCTPATVKAAPPFDYDGATKVHETAEAIVRHVANSVARLAHVRYDLAAEIEEEDFADDAIACALGEETGCLDPDDLTAENCELLFVEKTLREFVTPAPSVKEASPESAREWLEVNLPGWNGTATFDAIVQLLEAHKSEKVAVSDQLQESLQDGLLFGNADEPLDEYGKRIVRVVLWKMRGGYE